MKNHIATETNGRAGGPDQRGTVLGTTVHSNLYPILKVPSAALPQFGLSPSTSARVRSGFRHLLAGTDGTERSRLALADAAGSLLGDEVPEIVALATRMRAADGPTGIVLDNLPVEADSTGRTPLAELASLAIARIFGEPFGYEQKKGGQVVFPLRTRAGYEGAANTSYGNGVFTAHTDNAGFAPDFCGDAVELLGVRNDEGVPTSIIPLAHVLPALPPDVVEILQEARFTHPITAGFAFRMNVSTRPSPVLRRSPEGEWQIALSAGACRPADARDNRAAEALQLLEAVANDPRHALPVVIGPGRALIASQRRCLHQRAAFRGERLVLRTYVAWDLGAFRSKTGQTGLAFNAWELLR